MIENKLIFFTHIPKTAGGAVRDIILRPNVNEKQRIQYRGIKSVMFESTEKCKWVEGHIPYGVHKYMAKLNKNPLYITMLRSPIEQMISYYYYSKFTTGNKYEHPAYEDAKNTNITDFYSYPVYQNMQSKYIAGFISKKIYNKYTKRIISSHILDRAKNNLKNKFEKFGIVDRFKESIEKFSNVISVEYEIPERKVNSNQKRPRKEELSEGVIEKMKSINKLDVELYSYAKKEFDRQEG